MSMPASPWPRLYTDVKIQIPGVTDAVMAQVGFSLFKDFCDKTNIWCETVVVPVLPNVVRYAFSVTEFGAPNRLLLMYDPALPGPDYRWVQSGISMQVPGIIDIVYSPSTAYTWAAIVAKTPLEEEGGYPAMKPAQYWIVDKYREALTYGIIARLQMMPGKPYSNGKDAKQSNQYYISERSKARADAVKANVYGGQRWVFPQGFRTITRGTA